MNVRAMCAIVRKDLKVVSQNKNILIPMIMILLIFFVVIPWVIGLTPTLVHGMGIDLSSVEGLLARMPASMQQDFEGYAIGQKVVVYALMYMLLPFFLMIPLIVASMFAADSFAGEKERKTLEALLYTPTTDWELLSAKMLSGWLAAVAMALVGFLIYTINVNAAAWSQMQRIFFPNALWLVMVIWVIPALSGLGVSVMVAFSSRAQGFQDANQIGGLLVLPIVALFYAQIAGAVFLNVSIMFLMGLGVWMMTGVCTWLASRSFHRNRLLAA